MKLTHDQRFLVTDVVDGAITLVRFSESRSKKDWREMLDEMRVRITDLERGLGLSPDVDDMGRAL